MVLCYCPDRLIVNLKYKDMNALSLYFIKSAYCNFCDIVIVRHEIFKSKNSKQRKTFLCYENKMFGRISAALVQFIW